MTSVGFGKPLAEVSDEDFQQFRRASNPMSGCFTSLKLTDLETAAAVRHATDLRLGLRCRQDVVRGALLSSATIANLSTHQPSSPRDPRG